MAPIGSVAAFRCKVTIKRFAREFPAEIFRRSTRTQKQSCRPLQGLQNGIKEVYNRTQTAKLNAIKFRQFDEDYHKDAAVLFHLIVISFPCPLIRVEWPFGAVDLLFDGSINDRSFRIVGSGPRGNWTNRIGPGRCSLASRHLVHCPWQQKQSHVCQLLPVCLICRQLGNGWIFLKKFKFIKIK